MSVDKHLRTEYIAGKSEPGLTTGTVVSIDDRIVIDEFDPAHPEVLWYCDHCDKGTHVTAQFVRGAAYITLCATCLQHGLNGIALSLANPVSLDRPEGPT